MNDRKLYEQILGINEPWHVERVDLRLDQGEVLIHVQGTSASEVCPSVEGAAGDITAANVDGGTWTRVSSAPSW